MEGKLVMEEEFENEIHENCIAKGFSRQDYAKVCFDLSRSDDNEDTCVVSRGWIGDVASYIVELENIVKRATDCR